MTEDQNLDHDVELNDDENEIMEAQGHDPKNAEAQSVASVDKAGETTGSAPKRKGDNTKQDPMPKTKAGLINAMYSNMSKAPKMKLQAMYNGMMKAEGFESEEEGFVTEAPELAYEADFSEDLNALISDEATLSEEFKQKAETIFEAAIKHKLSEEIDRLEAKYEEELAEEISSTKSDLVEKVDSYLNYVVEQWMADNQVAIQTGLRAEIAENFMEGLKGLFQESYIEVPESKVDLVDDLAETVEELEEKLNETDLAATEVEKLKSLVEDVDFEDAETFARKVETVKESYFKKDVTESKEAAFTATEEDGDSPVVTSGAMAQYLSALQKTSTK